MNKEKLEKLQQDGIMRERSTLVGNLLATIDGEYTREGITETPWRVANMYDELFVGYTQDAKQILMDASFTEKDSDSMVLVKDINFFSTCEHHIMPFFGTVAIAYIPKNGKIVGLSKIARIVDVFAKRLQVQERLGQQILDTIQEVLDPIGIAVVIKAEHTCMTARGISKPGAQTVTSHLTGVFKLDGKAREEFYNALKL